MPRETDASFEVEIEFAGMCMFVRDPTKKQMHVLLPRVRHHPPHVARLFVPRAHHPSPPPAEPYKPYSLSGRVLDLTSFVGGRSRIGQLDGTIVDLSTRLNKRVPRSLLDGESLPPGDVLAARVTLDDGGMPPDHVTPGIEWDFGGAPRLMAIAGTWKIPRATTVPDDLKAIVRVRPGAKLKLHVFNAQQDETPGTGHSDPLPEVVDHFDDYYSLIRGVTAGERVKPRRLREAGSPLPTSTTGTRFTCIMAQAEAEP